MSSTRGGRRYTSACALLCISLAGVLLVLKSRDVTSNWTASVSNKQPVLLVGGHDLPSEVHGQAHGAASEFSYGASSAFTKGSAAWCEAAAMLQVCSHRANAAEIGEQLAYVSAIEALGKKGIICHDIDLVTTADQFLLAGHPTQVKDFIERSVSSAIISTMGSNSSRPPITNVELYTMMELKSMGAGNLLHQHPMISDLMVAFKRVMKLAETAPPHHKPLLFVELKGAAFSQSSIAYISQQAQLLDLQHDVAVWFPDAAHEETNKMLNDIRQFHLPVLTAHAYFDSVVENGQRVARKASVEAGDEAYDILGPSINAGPESLWTGMQRLGKPIAAWLVDDEDSLMRALKRNVSMIISNKPIEMKELVGQKMLQSCSLA